MRPGGHCAAVPRHHPNGHGYAIGPDDVVITGDAGLVVVLNSVLWHMRPPHLLPGARYYLNYSFIAPGPIGPPERDEYTTLFAELASAVPAGPGRDRVTALVRPTVRQPAQAAQLTVAAPSTTLDG